jgi:hypothetical protein
MKKSVKKYAPGGATGNPRKPYSQASNKTTSMKDPNPKPKQPSSTNMTPDMKKAADQLRGGKQSFNLPPKQKKGGAVPKKANGGPTDDISRGEARLTNRINRNKIKLDQAKKEYNQTPEDPTNLYRMTADKKYMLEQYIDQKSKKVQRLEDKKARKYPTKTYVAKTGGAVKRKK